MRERFACVLFPQVFDEVHQVHRHVLLADAAAHAQLVKPRLLP